MGSHVKRRERVLSTLRNLALKQIEDRDQGAVEGDLGFSTSEIAVSAGVTRSNCSGELNELFRLGSVVKLPGRPTRYWPADVAVENQAHPNRLSFPMTFDENRSAQVRSRPKDAFENVVGASRSLLEAVRLAKMSVSYPPLGMHALILGEAGVGKSTFAKTMHSYAIETGLFETSAPFVSFNCAEYANNPEILLDHLFGHVRGAFTGATEDKPGLIEVANRGVLFLDEIHRLPPQGQEMLFHWLDNGSFRRMGEVESKRESHALLIAATTETDESVLLVTFRRRIPVTINLPPLHEWSIYDRYELIYHCLFEEAETLKRPIRLNGGAVDKFLFSHLPGNIGGLRNALKLACARAYAFENQEGALVIERHHVQLPDVDRVPFVTSESLEKVKDIYVVPSESPSRAESNTSIFEESLYGHLSRLGERLQDIGLEHDEIVVAIERELMRRQFTKSVNPSLSELRRFVGDTLYSWMRSSWAAVTHRIDPSTMESSFIRVCVHLAGLTRDAKDYHAPIDKSVFHHIRQEYPDLCSIAETLLAAFTRESGIQLPEYEVPLVALLLKPSVPERTPSIGIVLMLRGESIATQIAQSVRTVSLSATVVSIDVPLNADVDWIRDSFNSAIQMADSGKGVLLLTDLAMVRDSTSDNTNLRCHYRPDLTTVLQAIVAIESGMDELSEVTAWLERDRQLATARLPNCEKRRVWTCCMTGRGSAMALKRLIENALPAELLTQVEITPVEVNPNGSTSAIAGDELIAMVGSVRPDVPGVPFLSVEELLAPHGMDRLMNIIGHMQAVDVLRTAQTSEAASRESLMAHAEQMLQQDLILVNPHVAMKAAFAALDIFLGQLQLELEDAWQVRFAIHMAYVVERTIRGNTIEHPESETLERSSPALWLQVKQALLPYEEWFQIELPAGEIAYICDMLLQSSQRSTQS